MPIIGLSGATAITQGNANGFPIPVNAATPGTYSGYTEVHASPAVTTTFDLPTLSVSNTTASARDIYVAIYYAAPNTGADIIRQRTIAANAADVSLLGGEVAVRNGGKIMVTASATGLIVFGYVNRVTAG